MRIKILGAAAGGGFPQWNCNCPNCAGVRAGSVRAQPRTQSSIAITVDSKHWVLFNASPDILTQLRAAPMLQPGRTLRDTGIAAVILTDGQIDHTTGLFMLREGGPLEIYCTEPVRADLTTAYPVFRILEKYCGVRVHSLTLTGDGVEIPGMDGLRFTAVPLAGNAPPYSPRRGAPAIGDTIGVVVEGARDQRLFYAPALANVDAAVESQLARADCVLVDGTFWSDDELVRLGVSASRACDMGHLPQSGADGLIERLAPFTRPRKILIHINNTNPILNEDSRERAHLTAAGIEVAYDGMEIEL